MGKNYCCIHVMWFYSLAFYCTRQHLLQHASIVSHFLIASECMLRLLRALWPTHILCYRLQSKQ